MAWTTETFFGSVQRYPSLIVLCEGGRVNPFAVKFGYE